MSFDPGRVRVVFMGTPRIAVPFLDALVKEGYSVAGVLTRPDKPAGRGYMLQPSPVRNAAENHGIPVITPGSLKNEDDWKTLREWSPDVIVVVAYGKILPKEMLEFPRFGCVNVHASLLPELRGASPIQWAILKGFSLSGLTLMKMDEGMDTGPVLDQCQIGLDPEETSLTLTEKMMDQGPPFLLDTLSGYLMGRIQPVPQKEEGSLAPLIRKNMGKLDFFTQTADEVDRHVRAMTPWPGTFCDSPLGTLKILSGSVWKKGPVKSGIPGMIVEGPEQEILVRCGSGVYSVREIQKAGGKAMFAREFLRGHKSLPGIILNSA